MSDTEDAEAYAILRDTLERANPHDADEAEVSILANTVDRLIDYIESLPCRCTPDAGPPSEWDVEPCARCSALNRAQNHHPDSWPWPTEGTESVENEQTSYPGQVRKTITTDVLDQEVLVIRRTADGMVWLHAPQGVALDADEAWAVAQAMVASEPTD